MIIHQSLLPPNGDKQPFFRNRAFCNGFVENSDYSMCAQRPHYDNDSAASSSSNSVELHTESVLLGDSNSIARLMTLRRCIT